MIEATFTLLEVHCDYPGCDRMATETKTTLERDGWRIVKWTDKTYCLRHRLCPQAKADEPKDNE